MQLDLFPELPRVITYGDVTSRVNNYTLDKLRVISQRLSERNKRAYKRPQQLPLPLPLDTH